MISKEIINSFNIKEHSIKDWKRKYTAKQFNDSGLFPQLEAGWYYFDCPIVMLKRKTSIFSKILKGLNERCEFSIEKYSAMFINCIDKTGYQVDELRIYNIETDEVIYSIERLINENVYRIFNKKDNFSNPEFFDEEEDVIDYLMTTTI